MPAKASWTAITYQLLSITQILCCGLCQLELNPHTSATQCIDLAAKKSTSMLLAGRAHVTFQEMYVTHDGARTPNMGMAGLNP